MGGSKGAPVVATLTFIVRDGRVLLIRKKRGFGEGKVNGVGGKLEGSESPEEAAAREVLEEVGVRVRGLRWAGVLYFYSGGSEPDWVVHVYTVSEFEGTPVETAEALPTWAPLDKLPLGEMWEDDRYWLPYVLASRRVEGHFYYDEGYTRIVRYVLKVW